MCLESLVGKIHTHQELLRLLVRIPLVEVTELLQTVLSKNDSKWEKGKFKGSNILIKKYKGIGGGWPQLDPGAQTMTPGSGLGLSICWLCFPLSVLASLSGRPSTDQKYPGC